MQRRETIYSKGFNMSEVTKTYRTATNEYKNIKVGIKTLDDAVLNLGSISKIAPKQRFCFGNKQALYKAIMDRDMELIRAFSHFFYKTNGIYFKLC
jgi:hypothetical protein